MCESHSKDMLAYISINYLDCSDETKFGTLEWDMMLPTPGRVRVDVKYTITSTLDDNHYDNIFLILCEEKMKLIKSVSASVEFKLSTIAENFIRAFERRQTAVHFLKEILADQISRTTDPRVIFRANTLASKAFDLYLKMIALPHLQKILRPIISEVFRARKSCEMDPLRVEDPKVIKKNQKNLQEFAEAVVDSVCESIHYLPLALRNIFHHVREELKKKFPGDDIVIYSGLSGFIFLRFICPAIMSPTMFGLVSDHAQVTVARDLTILAKTIQTMANLQVFGMKEPNMVSLNDFLQQQHSRIKKFLDELSTVPDTPIDEIPVAHSNINFGKEMAVISKYLSYVLSSQPELITKANDSQIIRLNDILKEIQKKIDEDDNKSYSQSSSHTVTTPRSPFEEDLSTFEADSDERSASTTNLSDSSPSQPSPMLSEDLSRSVSPFKSPRDHSSSGSSGWKRATTEPNRSLASSTQSKDTSLMQRSNPNMFPTSHSSSSLKTSSEDLPILPCERSSLSDDDRPLSIATNLTSSNPPKRPPPSSPCPISPPARPPPLVPPKLTNQQLEDILSSTEDNYSLPLTQTQPQPPQPSQPSQPSHTTESPSKNKDELIRALQRQMQSLTNQLDDLKEEHDQLKTMYIQLQEKHTKLEKSHESIQKEFSSMKLSFSELNDG
eukprot:TRINITY_DN3419_c1_g3_i1.p1 TRINITY_DN3419_c1_g3~~TRINITY_DN3419_c1_g3_i1.p1  ORF type:complete len:669 (+),score=167.06 TRINITY_DN3419_c1_g3_i1:383-2389(+)